jgi:hypothetical protein
MTIRTYTIYNIRLDERKYIEAENYRQAFMLTGWYQDRCQCAMVPYRDTTLRQRHFKGMGRRKSEPAQTSERSL